MEKKDDAPAFARIVKAKDLEDRSCFSKVPKGYIHIKINDWSVRAYGLDQEFVYGVDIHSGSISKIKPDKTVHLRSLDEEMLRKIANIFPTLEEQHARDNNMHNEEENEG